MYRSITVLFAIFVLLLLPIMAQDNANPPDYQVVNTSYEVSPDQTEIVVLYSVYNSGGDGQQDATVQLVEVRNSTQVLAEMVLGPLEGNGGNLVDIPLRFPVTRYAPGESIALNVIVTIVGDQAPLNNAKIVNVTMPNYDPATIQQQQQQQSSEGDDLGSSLGLDLDLNWWRDLEIDTSNSTHLAVIGGVIALWLLIGLFVKLFLGLFRRPPAFGNWQPPYATMPPLDPQSTYGKRQAWQQYAMNNIVPMPCRAGQVHARKVLLGMDGVYLSSWTISAVRMTQYDMYGRVSRSQVLASKGMVKKLTRAARRSSKINDKHLARRVRPVAKYLAKQFRKRVNKRSAMLPIALDFRFTGKHGEVRIMFELMDCAGGIPRQIDFWEPEMTVVGRTIYESYTYTLFGQRGDESFRDFKKRLAGDIERVLMELMRLRSGTHSTPSHTGPSLAALSNSQEMQAEQPQAQPQPQPQPQPHEPAEDTPGGGFWEDY